MPASWYANGIKGHHDGSIDWDTSTIKGVLVRDTYTPDFDTHDNLDDIPSAQRAGGTSFQNLNSRVINIDAANNEIEFDTDGANLVFPTVTNGHVCRAVVVFVDSGVESTSRLISYNQLASDVVADGGSVTITIPAEGYNKITY